MRAFIFVALLLASAAAYAQRGTPTISTVANLPATCTAGTPFIVTDGASARDCATGGGSTAALCICDAGGSSYTAAGNGGSGADSCFSMIVENIAVADEWEIELPNWAGTMTDFRCEAQAGTSFTVDVCDGEDLGDDTCTTSILGAPLACTTTGANDSTLLATGFVANDSVSIVVTAVSGSVTWARMRMNCQRD